MYHRLNGIKFNIDDARTLGGTLWPAGVLRKNPQRWAELGITEHADEPAPDYALNHVAENEDGTYTQTAKTQAELETQLEVLVASRSAEVNLLAAQKRDAVVSGISPAEMASWPIKRAEAMAYSVSGNPADAPVLALEAQARGVTVDTIVQRVLANATALSAIEAGISGVCGKHRDALTALGTQPADVPAATAAVIAYDINAGWPV